MEHIYTPSSVKHLEIPYLCSVEPPYFGNGFLEFPERYTALKGWEANADVDLTSERYGRLPLEEVEAFLQSWFYFGVIVEFFRVGGVEVDLGKFVDGRRKLATTAELRRYLQSWVRILSKKRLKEIAVKKKELRARKAGEIAGLEAELERLSTAKQGGGDDGEEKARGKRTAAIKEKIEKLGQKEKYHHDYHMYSELMEDKDASINNPDFRRAEPILSRLNATIRRHLQGNFSPESSPLFPVRWTVITSMVSLGYTLRNALLSTFVVEPWRPINANDWPTPPVLVDLMASKGFCRMDVGRLVDHVDHEGIYYAGVAMEAQKSTTRGGLKHDMCTDRLCKAGNINEKKYTFKHGDGCDGKCSPVAVNVAEVIACIKADKSPIVRWVEEDDGSGGRLVVSAADGKKVKYVAISHVWSDGMGNPEHNALPICILRDIQMRVNTLYENKEDEPPAKGSTEKESTENWKGKEEVSTEPKIPQGERIPLESFWMDTLCIPVQRENKIWREKSILRMASIYHDSDKVLILDSWLREIPADGPIEEIALRAFLCEWMHRLWTLQEGILTRKPYFQLRDAAVMSREIGKKAWSLCKSKKELGYFMKFPNLTFGKVNENFDDSLIGGVLSTHKGPGNWPTSETFKFRIRSVHHRRTSRRADETLCMASLMHMDVAKLLDIPGDGAELADRRMEWFLGEVGKFGKGIIFHECERMPKQGMRWAPRSLLDGRPFDLHNGIEHESSEGGLYSKEMKSFYCLYPGVTGIHVRAKAGPKVILEATSANEPHRRTRRYSLELLSDKKARYYIWDRLCEHAAIVQAVAMTDLQAGRPVKALVGSFTMPRDGGMMVPLRAENVATIEFLNDNAEDDEGLDVVKCNESSKEPWIIK